MVHPNREDGPGKYVDENGLCEIKVDTALEILSDTCRREILRYFIEDEPDIAFLDELAEHVYQRGLEAGKSTSHSDVLTKLHHHHLPKLDADDYVEYDHSAKAVKYNAPDGVEDILSAIENL